jgi:hypothetical protein
VARLRLTNYQKRRGAALAEMLKVLSHHLRRLWMLVFASRATPVFGLAWLAMVGAVALTFFGGARELTVLALGIGVLGPLNESRHRAETRKVFQELLAEAVYEACHNLHHLAKSYPKDEAEASPKIRVAAADRLLQPPLADLTLGVPGTAAAVDHILRNAQFLALYSPSDEHRKAIKDEVGYFIEHCVNFVIAAGRAGADTTGVRTQEVIAALGLPYLREMALPRRVPPEHGPWRMKVRRAEAVVNKRGLPEPFASYFWYDDKPGQHLKENEVREQAIGPLFSALTDPPPRPGGKLPPTVIQEIREQHENRTSKRKVANDLNTRWEPTSGGRLRWYPWTVRAALRSPEFKDAAGASETGDTASPAEAPPSLSTSGETLTIEESMNLEGENGERRRCWSRARMELEQRVRLPPATKTSEP